MNKASVITIQIPIELKHRIEIIAEEQGVSLNQLAMYMFAKEASSFEAKQSISSYWKGYTKQEIIQEFDNTMKKVKTRELPTWDKI